MVTYFRPPFLLTEFFTHILVLVKKCLFFRHIFAAMLDPTFWFASGIVEDLVMESRKRASPVSVSEVRMIWPGTTWTFCGFIHFVGSNGMILSYFISNWCEWYEWYGFLLNFAGTFSMLIWLRIVVCGWYTLYTVAACHVLTGFSVRVSMLHHVTISLAHRRFICIKSP